MPLLQHSFPLVRPSLLILFFVALVVRLPAANGTWTNNASSNWSTTTNWSGGIVADGATFTADFSTLNITGTRTITLDTSRTLGTLKFGDASSTTNSYILNPSGGATLTFDNGASPASLQALSTSNGDTVAVALLLNSSLTITNAMTSSRVLTLSNGISASSAGAKTLANVGSGSGITLISGSISDGGAGGSIALTTSNTTAAGGMTLSGTNSFSGGVTLTSGVLNINSATALGSGALTIASGTLDNKSAGALTLGSNNTQNWNGSFTYTGTNSLDMGTGAVTLGANVTATVSANTLSVGGIGQTGGSRSLTKAGAGTLVINGASSYAGGTTISGGVLRFGTGAGTVPTSGNFTINANAALAATGSTGFTTGALWLASGRIVTTSAGALALVADESSNFNLSSFSSLFIGAIGNVTYSGILTPHATGGYRLGGGGGILTVTSPLGATSAANVTSKLTVNGNVVLTGSNHYKGDTTVNNGLLTFSGLDQLGLNSAITLNGGGLQLAAGSAVDVTARSVTLGTSGGTIDTNGNGVTFSRALNGTGVLTKAGAGTLTLEVARAAAGGTTVANGTLRLGVANALSTTSALTLGSGTTAGTLNLNGNDQQVAAFSVLSNSTTAVNRLIITSGNTFTTTGNVTIGLDGLNTTTLFKAEGGGTWDATSSAAAAVFQIGGATGSANYNTATADLSGLASLNVRYSGTSSVFRVGDTGNIASINNPSVVTLARQSLIQAARISVGGDSGSTVQQTLNLGAVSTVLNASFIDVGASTISDPRSNGTLAFGFGTGTLVVRAQDGTGRAEMRVISSDSGSGNSMTGTVNLAGHDSDLLLSTLTIGRRTRNNGVGAATGLMVFDMGRLNAETLNIAHRIGTVGANNGAGTGTVAGTLTISGGDVDLGTVVMAFNSSDKTEATAKSVATLNINRGTVDVTGTLTGARHESTGNAAEGTINIAGDAVVTVQQINLAQTTSTGNAVAVLNVRNGVLNIGSGGLVLAGSATVGSTASGTLNVTGGRVVMAGNISDAGGTGTSTSVLTLSGGMLDLGGNAIVNVDTLTWGGGTLQNVGSINGAGGLTKTTTGVLTLAGTNTWTGNTTLNAGTVVFSANAALGGAGSALVFAGNSTLRWAMGSTADISARTITLNAASRLDTNGNDVTLANGIGNNGSGSLIKAGLGMLRLQGANLYSGTTAVRGGTLLLDFSGSNTGATRLGAGGLSLEGGTLLILGTDVAGQSTTQALGGTSVTAGSSTIGVTVQGTSAATLDLGAITRGSGGGTVDFTLPAAGGVTTSTANANGSGGSQTILGGYATVGGTTWAVSGSGATAGTISGLASFSYSTGFVAGADVNATTGTSTPAAMTINSLRFNTAGAYTVNTAGAITIATGGILVTTGVGSNNIAINNNSLTSGNGQDLIIHQNNTAGTLTIASAITGGIGLTKSGAGALVLSGANTYTGSTVINDGKLTVRTEGTTIGAAGSLGVVPGSTDADNIIINGGTLAANTNVTLDAKRGVQIGENGATLRHESGRFWINGIIADLPNQQGVLTIEGSTPTGGDDLVLGGNNTYTGGTILAANARVLAAANGVFGTGTLTFAGGRVRAGTGSDVTLSNAYVFAADTTFHNPIAGQKSLILTGNGILSGGNRVITVEATSTPTVSVTLSGSLGEDGSARSLTKNGPGRLVLTGFNTYSGGTVIQGGVLQIGVAAGSSHTNADAALGAVPATATPNITFTGNSTLQLATNAGTVLAATRTLAISTGVTATLDANGGSLTVLGQITGAGALNTGAAGTVALASTASSYQGGTSLGGATLIIAGDGSLGDAAGDVTFNASSTLQTLGDVALNAGRTLALGSGVTATLTAEGSTLTINGQVTGAGSLALSSTAGTVVLAAANNFTGGTTVGGPAVGGALLRLTHANALAATSGIDIGQAGGDDTSRLELDTGGTMTVSAPLTVTSRTSSAAHVENVSGSSTLNGSLTSNGTSQTNFQSDAGELRLEFTAVTNTGSTVGLQGAGSGTVAANLFTAGATGGMVKNGGGTWAITAAQTSTGVVQVNNGTLLANNTTGSATGTGDVIVSGGTLGGTGSIGGNVLVNGGGALRVGDAAVNGGVGTLAIGGSLELSGALADIDRLILQGAGNAADTNDAGGIAGAISGNTLAAYLTGQATTYEGLNSGNHDRLVVAGNLTLEENAVVRFGRTDSSSAYTVTPGFGDVFDLLDWNGVLGLDGFSFGGAQRGGGLVGDLDLPTLGGGLSYDMSLFTSNGIIVVVPEPERALLIAGGVLLLGLRRRRKRLAVP